MSAAKIRESASTRIDKLVPEFEGCMSDAAMGNRAGFRKARDLAAQIASEHDVIAGELLERLEELVAILAGEGYTHSLVSARAAIAKAKATGIAS